MRIDRLRILLASVLALGFASAPGASLAQDYVRDGWYGGVRGFYALPDFDAEGKTEDAGGFAAYFGWRAWKMFGADLEFERVGNFHVSGKGAPSYDVRTFNFGLNLRAYPLGRLLDAASPLQRAQPYLSAGIANQWVKIDGNPGNERHEGDAAGRFGGGLDVYLTESLVLTADARYMLGFGEVSDERYWTFGGGLQWRFGAGGEAAAEGDEDAEDEAAEDDDGGAEDDAPDDEE
jgi:hypothetical protein